MTNNDVDKRWHDPQALRAAVIYVGVVIALAATAFFVTNATRSLIAFFATNATRSLIAGLLVPLILFVGGIGAFVRTYQVWRVQGAWPIWQAAGWILLMLFLLGLSTPAAVWSAAILNG